MQGNGSELADPAKSPSTRSILAKRIIAMAMSSVVDVTKLRDDALAQLHNNLPTS
jgi:hypothetical protein